MEVVSSGYITQAVPIYCIWPSILKSKHYRRGIEGISKGIGKRYSNGDINLMRDINLNNYKTNKLLRILPAFIQQNKRARKKPRRFIEVILKPRES